MFDIAHIRDELNELPFRDGKRGALSEAPVGAHEHQAGNKDNPGTQVSEENAQAQCEDRWRDDGGQGGFDKEKPS